MVKLYRVQKHKVKNMTKALSLCAEYVLHGIPAFVIPDGEKWAVCFKRYAHIETAETLKRALKEKHDITNVSIIQEA